MDKLKVVTVLRSGGEYDQTHVYAVKAMVDEHVTLPHTFICYSDVPIDGVNVYSLQYSWPGWYAKMEIYREPGPVLYLDLDTIILNNLDALLREAMKHTFIVLRDFYRGCMEPGVGCRGMTTGDKSIGSGLMFWNGDQSDIYNTYARNPVALYGGDQILLERMFKARSFEPSFWQDITDEIVSYKAHVLRQSIDLKTVKVVCFHGAPRPWDQQLLGYFPESPKGRLKGYDRNE